MRPAARVAAMFVLAMQAAGQQAVLPRKGRQPERSTPLESEPISRLPTRRTPGTETPVVIFGPHAPDRPQSEDRLRPLVRGEVTPLRGAEELWIRELPRERLMAASAMPPLAQTQATAVPN